MAKFMWEHGEEALAKVTISAAMEFTDYIDSGHIIFI